MMHIVFEIMTGIAIGIGIGLIIGITLRVMFDAVMNLAFAQSIVRRVARWGVVCVFVSILGTGAGRSAQDTVKIDFSPDKEAA